MAVVVGSETTRYSHFDPLGTNLYPVGLAAAGVGDLYIADSLSNVVWHVSSGDIWPSAGELGWPGPPTAGSAIYSELGGLGGGPNGVAIDSSGDYYIADTPNDVVEEVSSSGSLSVVAGEVGVSGTPVAGPALSSPIVPSAVALNASGDLFIADSPAHEVLEVTPGGTLSVVAGTGTAGAPTAGPATSSDLGSPVGLGVDSSGNVYVADQSNYVVEELASGGDLSVVAGDGAQGAPVDGTATSSPLGGPSGVAVGPSGDLYIADPPDNVIEEVNTSGTLSVVAGTGTLGPPSAGPATSSDLDGPSAVAVDPSGDLYIADTGNNVVEEVNTSGDLSLFAGALGGFSPGSPPGELNADSAVATDGSGDIYVADTGNCTVDKLDNVGTYSSGSLTVVAGRVGDCGTDTLGPATSSDLDQPSGVAVSAFGDLYIADSANNVVEEVTPGGTLHVFAGTGTAGAPTPGPATSSDLDGPTGIALDGSGDLYVADSGNNMVEEISPTGTLAIVAGTGAAGAPTSGTAIYSDLDDPTAVAPDGSGNVYIADRGNNVVEEVGAWGDLSVVAGTGTVGPPTMTTATSSDLDHPSGLALDNAGDLFISDAYGPTSADNLVLELSDRDLSTVAGDGTTGPPRYGTGYAISDRFGQAGFAGGTGLAIDPLGDLYIADGADNDVEEVALVGSTSLPAPPTAVQTAVEDVVPEGTPVTKAVSIGARDETADCNCYQTTVGHRQVSPGTGALIENSTDISVPGAGVPLELTRTYDSSLAQMQVANATAPGPLGYGWSYNLGMSLSLDSSTGVATIDQEDGSEISFTPYVAAQAPEWCTGAENYCPDAPRDLATLEKNSDGSWTFVRYGGGQDTTFDFSSAGALESETDEAGGSLTASAGTPGSGECPSAASGCTVWTSSASGRTLTLAMDSSGRLLSATDNGGNTASYCYFGQSCASGASDGGAQDLYSATAPGGAETTYGYDSSNSSASLDDDILTEDLPTGGTVTNTYNTSGEVTAQDAPSFDVTLSYSGDNQAVSGGSTVVATWPTGTSGPLAAEEVQYDYSSGALVGVTTGYGTSAASTQYLDLDPTSLAPTTVQDGDGNQADQTLTGDTAEPLSVGNVTLSTDALGNTTQYRYNADNQAWCEVGPAEYLDGTRCPSSAPSSPPSPGTTDPYAGATISFYGSDGLLTAETDPLGNTTTYSYTNDVTGVPDGLVYCSVGPVAYQAGVTCPAYGASHVSGTTTKTFDSAGDVTSSSDADGNTTTYSYGDSSHPGLPTSSTGPDGTTTSSTYNAAGQVTEETVDFGSYSASTLYAYDGAGEEYCTVAPAEVADGVTCPSSPPTTAPTPGDDAYLGATITTYNAAGQAVQVTNPLGGITYTAYDSAGNAYCTVGPAEAALGVTCPSSAPSTAPTLSDDPYLGATITTYDAEGQAVQVTNPLGGITLSDYDGAGNLTQTTVESNSSTSDPDVVTSYGYNADNEVTSTTVDPSGGTAKSETTQSYDPDGNVYCSASADAVAGSDYQCPAWQAAWATTPPKPSSLYSTTPSPDQANNVTTTFYDADGDQRQSTDPDLQTTVNAFDGDGRTYCTSDPTNVGAWLTAHPSDSYPYICPSTPPSSPPSTGSNPGYVTTIYDAAGLTLSTTDQDGSTTTYTYSPGGQVLVTTNPGGDVTTNCYYYQDATGQCAHGAPAGGGQADDLYSTTTPATAADSSGQTTYYTYYPGGQADTTATPAGTTTDSYDANGDLETVDYGSPASGYSSVTDKSYTYNVDGSPGSMTDATGTTTYGYDANGDITSVTNGAGKELQYSYFSTGNLSTLEYPNDEAVSYKYDALGEESSLTDWLDNTTDFGYDAAGHLTTTTLPNGVTETTGYDNAGEISSMSDTKGASTLASFDYTRGPDGNVTEESDTGLPGPSAQSYDYDAAARATSDNSASYTYDAQSDLTTGPGGATQAFDNAGELCWTAASPPSGSTCPSTPTGETTYTYDTAGDRTETDAPGSTTTYSWQQDLGLSSVSAPAGDVGYTYDGQGLLSARDQGGSSAELVWDPVESPSGPLLVDDGDNYYIYGPDGTATEQIGVSSGSVSYYSHDQSGSTRLLTDSSGTVQNSWTYDAWGETTATSCSPTTPSPTSITTVGSPTNATLSWGTDDYSVSVSPAAGDLLVLVDNNWYLSGSSITVSGGGVSAWNLAENGAGGNGGGDIWWGVVTSGGPSDITVDYPSNPGGGWLTALEYSAGAGATWVLNGANSNDDWSTDISYAPLTPTTGEGELYVGTTYNLPGSYTAGSTSGYSYPGGNGIVYGTDVTSTASPAATTDGSNWATLAVLFTAITGGTPTSITTVGSPTNATLSWGTDDYSVSVSPTAGDLLVLVDNNWYLSGSSITVSGGGVSTWNLAENGAGGNGGGDIWWGVVTSGGPSDITVDYPSNPGGGWLTALEYTAGTGATWVLNGANSNDDWSTDISYAPLTPTTGEGELYVGTTYNLPGSYTAGSTSGYSYPGGNGIVYGTDVTSTASPAATTDGFYWATLSVLFTAFAGSTCPATTPLLWDGQYQDPTTGLYYMRARWYDPGSGQFLSVDPELAVTGEPYAYAGDDPVNVGDPSGMAPCVPAIFNSDQVMIGGVYLVAGVLIPAADHGGAISELWQTQLPTLRHDFGGYGWGPAEQLESLSSLCGSSEGICGYTVTDAVVEHEWGVAALAGVIQLAGTLTRGQEFGSEDEADEQEVAAVGEDVQVDRALGTESDVSPKTVTFGGESEAAATGRAIHNVFDQQLAELSHEDPRWQPGLRSGPNRPDGFFDGDPIELKPNTPSGLRAGISQLNRYIEAFGASQGYLYTYDAQGNISLHQVLYP